MSKLPAFTGNELIAVLKKAGFVVERQRSSHVFLKHPDGRATVIPVHAGENIGPGLLARILRDTDTTRDELTAFLKK
jgi:predicted RNA binding protein YcfA (HicA-like mRNA interferase family)